MQKVFLTIFIMLLLNGPALTYGEEQPRNVNMNIDAKKMYEPSISSAFKQIKLSGKQGVYRVEGSALCKNGQFYYTVEDGHYEQIHETKVKIGKGHTGWKKFMIEVTIHADKLPQSGTLILNLYERSSEDGSIRNINPVILEKFY